MWFEWNHLHIFAFNQMKIVATVSNIELSDLFE